MLARYKAVADGHALVEHEALSAPETFALRHGL
jgi:hypothetical protein